MFARQVPATLGRVGRQCLPAFRTSGTMTTSLKAGTSLLRGFVSTWCRNPVGTTNAVAAAPFCTEASTPPPPAPVATYEEVLALPQHPEKLLVDVREPQELQETGVIPTSINVPLGEVATVFSDTVSPKQFKTRFGRVKPDADVQLIFMCKIGRRSESAAQLAIGLGYKNVKNYRGSWLDWAERNGLPQ